MQAEHEFDGEASTKNINCSGQLLLINFCLMFVSFEVEILPRERPMQKVYEDICQRLNVIATREFDINLSID